MRDWELPTYVRYVVSCAGCRTEAGPPRISKDWARDDAKKAGFVVTERDRCPVALCKACAEKQAA